MELESVCVAFQVKGDRHVGILGRGAHQIVQLISNPHQVWGSERQCRVGGPASNSSSFSVSEKSANMDYFSGWSTALCMLFAIMYYTDGLMYAKIEDEWQRCAQRRRFPGLSALF